MNLPTDPTPPSHDPAAVTAFVNWQHEAYAVKPVGVRPGCSVSEFKLVRATRAANYEAQLRAMVPPELEAGGSGRALIEACIDAWVAACARTPIEGIFEREVANECFRAVGTTAHRREKGAVLRRVIVDVERETLATECFKGRRLTPEQEIQIEEVGAKRGLTVTTPR